MAKHTKLTASIIENAFKAYVLDGNGKLKVVNETAAKQASKLLSKLVLEQSREWWDQLEASEGSLRDLGHEINFQELNAGPDQLHRDDSVAARASNNQSGTPQMESIKDMFGAPNFNFKNLVENFDGDEEHHEEGDVESDDDVVDGDENYDDMKIGHDDADMGLHGDDGDDVIDMGDSDEAGMDMSDDGEDASSGMDDLSDMGSSDEDADLGGDEEDGFDFKDLADLVDGEHGSEDGEEELKDHHGMMESEDEDEEESDKDDSEEDSEDDED